MKLTVAIVLALAVAACAAPMAKLSSKTEAEKKAMFHDHILQHNKVYATSTEFNVRFNNFKDTLERIDDLNARDQTATFGINKFSDLSKAEFRAMYLNGNAIPADVRAPMTGVPRVTHTVNVTSANGDVDWRSKVGQYMGAVRNQEQCGSCWAFSTSENVASVWALAGNPLTVLSVQQIVDCDTASYGCNGGEPINAYQYLMQTGGLESEASYPYTAVNGQCNSNPSDFVAKITSWTQVAQGGSDAVSKMKQGVATTPLSICVEADTWQSYTGGVLSSNCGQNIDHCVMLAGYSTSGSQPYWIVRNSWGTTWGEAGYIYVEIGQNLCAIQNMVTTAVA